MHRRWLRCPSLLQTLKIIFVHRFCCSSGHACFLAESFFVRKYIREASWPADLDPILIIMRNCWRKSKSLRALISPKTAENVFVRKTHLEGTLLKYRSYRTGTNIFVIKFLRAAEPQGHIANEKKNREFLQIWSRHSCHRQNAFSSAPYFSGIGCFLQVIL